MLPTRRPPIFGSQGVASIFDNYEPVLFGQIYKSHPGPPDVRHSRPAESTPRFGGDFLLDLLGIKVECVPADIGKHGSRPLIQNAIRGCCEGQRRRDRFVAGLKSGSNAAACKAAVPELKLTAYAAPHPRCEGLFELANLRTGGQPIGTQNIDYSLYIGIIDRLAPVRKEGRSHRRAHRGSRASAG